MRLTRIFAVAIGLAAAAALAGQALAGTPSAGHGRVLGGAAGRMPPAGTLGTLTVGGGGATVTPTDREGSPTGPTISEPELAPSPADLAAAQDAVGSAVVADRSVRRTVHAAAGCKDIDAWRYSTSFLFGTTVYRFHQTVHFCWNTASKLTAVTTGTYVSNVDPNWTYRGLTASNGYFFTWCCGNTHSGHFGLRQGHFDNCVLKYGCIGSEYPWVKIWIHGNGTWTYTTGQ
jgi:hypothetical protein